MVQVILSPTSSTLTLIRDLEATKMSRGGDTIYHLMREARMLLLDWVAL